MPSRPTSPAEPDAAASRPLVTLFVMAYRQERFVRAAVEGALAQTYSPLEIILSDDNSPDGAFAIMEEMAAAYDGPHRIRLNRNPANLGIVGHVNRLAALATARIEPGHAPDTYVCAGPEHGLPG